MENIIFNQIQKDFMKTYVYENYLLSLYEIISLGHLAQTGFPIWDVNVYILSFESDFSFPNSQLAGFLRIS